MKQQGTLIEILTQGVPDFGVGVALGNVASYSMKNRVARNAAISASLETVSDMGGLHPWSVLTASGITVHVVSSDNAEDLALTGDGARVVTIRGLDVNWAEQEEDISMDGTTAVTSALKWLRVNEAFVKTTGSDGFNNGIITVKEPTISAALCTIPSGAAASAVNQANMGLYTVPAGKKAIIMSIVAAGKTLESNSGQVEIFKRDNANSLPWQYVGRLSLSDASRQAAWSIAKAPIVLGEETDLDIRAVATSGNIDVVVNYDLVLED